jgi:streptomycin 6-kinase
MYLPPQFVETVHRIFGEDGREWLPRLPGILARCRAKWGLPTGAMCPTMSINYIEFTTTAVGQPVALKVGVPHSELYTEMEALGLYKGKRAVRLLDADRELGALLIQRLLPGTVLWQLGDNARETRIAASIMRELPVPTPATHHLPAFSRWVKRAFFLTRTEWDPQERMPRDLIDKAELAFQEIERTAAGTVVLHGDLHHENILLDERSGWTAIDPKGAIGPPCLEVGRYLHNQLPGGLRAGRREELLRERVDILSAELGTSPETVAASGLVDCVLSYCWSFEDSELGEDWPVGIELARALCKMAGV